MYNSVSAPSSGLVNTCVDRARIPGYAGLQQIAIDEQGKLQAIHPAQTQSGAQVLEIVDVDQDWISLGGIDL